MNQRPLTLGCPHGASAGRWQNGATQRFLAFWCKVNMYVKTWCNPKVFIIFCKVNMDNVKTWCNPKLFLSFSCQANIDNVKTFFKPKVPFQCTQLINTTFTGLSTDSKVFRDLSVTCNYVLVHVCVKSIPYFLSGLWRSDILGRQVLWHRPGCVW